VSESYFRHHVFMCVNKRENGAACCANLGSLEASESAKRRLKSLSFSARSQARINMTGCLNRCGQGPILVVYPEGVWYRYDTQEDIEEIIDRHVGHGEVVERLRVG
jgi:(2Fe-2S) ferredoxin